MRRCVESATGFGFKGVGRNCFTCLISDGHVATCRIEAARSHVQRIEQFVSHEISEWTLTDSFNNLTENSEGEIRIYKVLSGRECANCVLIQQFGSAHV